MPDHSQRRLPAALVPLVVLAAVSVVTLALPFRMVEPDDDDYYYGMHAFARGQVVMTEAEARELASIPMPDRFKTPSPVTRGIHSPKGWMRERSPGHYALLALLYQVRLHRVANVALAFACLAFFYRLVRRHLELSTEVAVLASLLLVLNPTFLTMLYRVYMSDFDYFVWATLSLGLYFAARQTGRPWLCAAAGLSLALSVAFRNTNAISFLVLGAYEVLLSWLRLREQARAGREGGAAEPGEAFGWARAALVAGGVVVGLLPLAWYGYATTGELFGSGYQYRLTRVHEGYFALWDSRAVFSLRHLFTGEFRGFMSHGHNLTVGLARLVQGYPLALLAPAGLLVMERRRLRPALFLALWVILYGGLYLCYGTIRADSFQFMCRKLSPALAPLAIGAAVALGQLPRRARHALFAALTVVSLGVTGEFYVQFLGGERPGVPPGAPLRGPGPGGPPLDELLRVATDRLADAPREASRALRELADFLRRTPPQAPERVRRAAEELAPQVENLSQRIAEAGTPLAQAKAEAFRKELHALEQKLWEMRPGPQGGPPEGPKGEWPPEPPPAGGPPFPPKPFGEGEGPARLVQRLHARIAEAERRGLDVSEARRLDEESKRAAARGDWTANRRLLQEAVEQIERVLGREPRPEPPGGPRPRPSPNGGQRL